MLPDLIFPNAHAGHTHTVEQLDFKYKMVRHDVSNIDARTASVAQDIDRMEAEFEKRVQKHIDSTVDTVTSTGSLKNFLKRFPELSASNVRNKRRIGQVQLQNEHTIQRLDEHDEEIALLKRRINNTNHLLNTALGRLEALERRNS